MKTFNEYFESKDKQVYYEFFKSKKKLYINSEHFIVDQDNNKIFDKPIYDYLYGNNPIQDLSRDLYDKNLYFANFELKELEKVFFLFLHKNSSKEIQKEMSPLSKNIYQQDVLETNDAFYKMILSKDFPKTFIDNLDIYQNDKAKLLDLFNFITRLLIFRISGDDLVKIILLMDEKDIEHVFEKLYDDRVGRKITIDNLFKIINAKKSAPTSYFERLIDAFVSNRNTNDKEIRILQKFVEDYNKNNPKNPIKPVNFEDLRMKNFAKKLPSGKDVLHSMGVSVLSTIADKLRGKL